MSARVRLTHLVALAGLLLASKGHAQISKGNQILINRGLQVEALVLTYDTFHLSTLSNANYTTVNWTWDLPRSYDSSMSWLGAAPGFPWARWASSPSDMPPLGGEAPYLSQLVNLQLGDEQNLNDDTIRSNTVDWFNAVRANWPNTILYINSWGGEISDGNLIDFVTRARPDMITFDTYPWKSVYDPNAPGHIGAPIGGPPTSWYTFLRIYRDISRSFNIPFGSYVQTFHAVEEYGPYNVYRSPSASELRLNHFGALAFNSKVLTDFIYNNGSSSLFDPPGGDSHPNALYYEKADCALRARNFGKSLVRLKPIDEATTQWTTSIMFVRGRDASGNLNPLPINFYAGPGGTDPNTDWVADRNDPYLRGWVVMNTGTKNNGQSGDVIIAWLKLLDESFDGPSYTNELYFMVVNGLTDTNGTAADCSQQIQLNFLDTFSAVEMMDPLTGTVQAQVLPVVSGRRQLTLNLNGGDAALFKVADGAPFVGANLTGPPVIVSSPASRTNLVGTTATLTVIADGAAPLAYRWRKNGADLSDAGNISGVTNASLVLSNLLLSDSGSYDVVVTGTSSVTSAPPAMLTVVSNLPSLLVFYEPFDYSNVGAPVSSNTPPNWALGGGAPNDLNVAPGSLSYSGLAASVGNSVTNGGGGYGVRRLFGTNFSSGVVYFSALFRMNNPGYGTWSGASAQVGALTATDSSSFRLHVLVKSNSPSGYVIGVQKGGASSGTFDTVERHPGDTLFLVGKYDFTVTPNKVSLWINPDASTFGAVAEPSSGYLSQGGGTDNLVIDRFNMRQNTMTSVPAAMQWDELRVGLSWASVTPVFVPGPVRLNGAMLLPGGSFRFAYTNTPDLAGTVYASSNLSNWVTAGTATQVSAGQFQFTDTSASSYPRRFYKMR